MKDKLILQAYVNNFRRHFSAYLKPGIGLACNIYPVESKGAILEFTVAPQIASADNFHSAEVSINKALTKIEQQSFGGDLEGFVFSGTNIIKEKDRLIFIKGDDDLTTWSDEVAIEDIMKIIPMEIKSFQMKDRK